MIPLASSFTALVLGFAASMPAEGESPEEALARIRRSMDDPSYTSYRAYHELGRLGKAALLLAARDEDPLFREAACSHLWKYVEGLTPADVAIIAQVLKNPEIKDLRGPKAAMAAASLLSGNKLHGIPVLTECLETAPSLEAICSAAGLVREKAVSDEALRTRALTVLVDAVGRSDQIGRIAENYLWNYPPPGTREAIRSVVLDKATSEPRLGAALEVLARHPEKEDTQVFLQFLNSPAERTRSACLEGLFRDLSEPVVRQISGLRADPSDRVRKHVFSCMRASKSPSMLPFLQEGLRDRSTFIVYDAIEGIAHLNDPAAGPALIELLRAPAEGRVLVNQVHTRAAEVLVQILGKEKEFTFNPTNIFCGTPMIEADQRIKKGEWLGGEAGRAMAEEARKDLQAMRDGMKFYQVKADAQNLREIRRLLEWWDGHAKPR